MDRNFPEPVQRPRRIKYHMGGSGAGVSAKDDMDNPLSANFLPMTDRDEFGKARWWALHGSRFQRIGVVEYD